VEWREAQREGLRLTAYSHSRDLVRMRTSAVAGLVRLVLFWDKVMNAPLPRSPHHQAACP
jgi:hypothetical protein